MRWHNVNKMSRHACTQCRRLSVRYNSIAHFSNLVIKKLQPTKYIHNHLTITMTAHKLFFRTVLTVTFLEGAAITLLRQLTSITCMLQTLHNADI